MPTLRAAEKLARKPMMIIRQLDPCAGMIPNFTGIDSPYEAPEQPEFHLQTVEHRVEELAEKIVEKISQH